MSIWYKTGTVAVVNGSNVVAGAGTLFTLNASIGDIFIGPDSKEYEITAVPSDTSLSIATPLGIPAYQGATLSAQPYAIIRNFTASVNATLASKLTNLLNTWQSREDQFRLWNGGTANGGLAFDGNYPLTDAVGVAQNIACPAKLQLLAGGQVKQAVKAASTGNLALSGNQTVDGIALVTNDRCLVKDQTTGSQNGIYLVAVGAWTRAADFDISADAYPQCLVPVEQGTVNLDTIWMLTTNSPVTLGSTALVFIKIYGNPVPVWVPVVGGVGFQAGWSNTGGGYAPCAYFKDPVSGIVTVKGRATGGTGTIIVLPVGVRPLETRAFALTSGLTAFASVTIDAVGNIYLQGGSGPAGITLDGISFATT